MYRTALMGWMAAIVLLGAAVLPARAEDNGVVKGKVIFKGDPDDAKFRRTVVDTSKDPNCKHKKKRIGSWSIILNKKTDPVTIQNVLVRVVEGLPDHKWPVPDEAVVLNQEGCEYEPHVLGIMEGQKLIVKNSDPTNHNIHFLPEANQQHNFTQPKEGMTQELTLTAEDPFKIKCDVHPWMGAYIGVFNHPFFAVTGDDGTFTITGLPPGKYVIRAWHEEFKTIDMTVEVASGETKEADFTYEPGK
jgi:plastocyanin